MNIRGKLTLLFFLLASLVLTGAGTFSVLTLQNFFMEKTGKELQNQASQTEYVIDNMRSSSVDWDSFVRGYSGNAHIRLTLIDSSGVVLFDSGVPRDSVRFLENHLQRPEVQEAIRNGIAQPGFGFGRSTRYSATTGTGMYYVAKLLRQPPPQQSGFPRAMVLRVAVPLSAINEAIADIRSKVILMSALILLIVIGMSVLLSDRLARPIREMVAIARQIRSGSLDRRLPVRSKDEFGQLAGAVNNMVDTLDADIIKLKKLEEVRSQFLGNVSHELRTPLFSLQGMLETLLAGAIDDPEVNRNFIERALANTRRLDSLLKDLIEISRIESGEMKMSLRYFPINDFLAPLIDELVPLAEQKNLQLRFEPQTENIQVFGDRMWLLQALTNIIENAIKYTKSGAVTVSTAATATAVTISVNDTGIGIPPEHLPRIFERFYRVDRERSREAGGTGLGLAIVKHIVEAHNSMVSVESTVGSGSKFSFTLPR